MALGTITPVTDTPLGTTLPVNLGGLKLSVTTVVGDSAYPTGGTAITAAQLGLLQVLFVIPVINAATGTNSAAVSAAYNAGKLQMFVTASTSPVTLQEAANAANLSGVTVTLIAFGY